MHLTLVEIAGFIKHRQLSSVIITNDLQCLVRPHFLMSRTDVVSGQCLVSPPPPPRCFHLPGNVLVFPEWKHCPALSILIVRCLELEIQFNISIRSYNKFQALVNLPLILESNLLPIYSQYWESNIQPIYSQYWNPMSHK